MLKSNLRMGAVLLGVAIAVTQAQALTWNLDTGGRVPPTEGTDVGLAQFFFNVSGEGNILDNLKVRLAIAHTSDADLTISLIAPNATEIVLVQNRGGAGDNFQDTLLDDSAVTPIGLGSIPALPPFIGTFQPEVALSNLYGIDPNGTWKLKVDDGRDGDFGYVYGQNNPTPPFAPWDNIIGTQLIITSHSSPPSNGGPGTAAIPEPMSAGLALLGLTALGLHACRRRA